LWLPPPRIPAPAPAPAQPARASVGGTLLEICSHLLLLLLLQRPPSYEHPMNSRPAVRGLRPFPLGQLALRRFFTLRYLHALHATGGAVDARVLFTPTRGSCTCYQLRICDEIRLPASPSLHLGGAH